MIALKIAKINQKTKQIKKFYETIRYYCTAEEAHTVCFWKINGKKTELNL